MGPDMCGWRGRIRIEDTKLDGLAFHAYMFTSITKVDLGGAVRTVLDTRTPVLRPSLYLLVERLRSDHLLLQHGCIAYQCRTRLQLETQLMLGNTGKVPRQPGICIPITQLRLDAIPV